MGALAKDSSVQSIMELLGYTRVVIPRPDFGKTYINPFTGVEGVAGGDTTSDYIELDHRASHLFCSMYTASSTISAVSFYDAQKTFIKGIFEIDNKVARDKSYPVEIPYNAKYVRFGILSSHASNWWGEYYYGEVISAIERVKYASEWHNDTIRVLTSKQRTTTAAYSSGINVEQEGAISLRIDSTFDCNCKIGLCCDDKADNDAMLMDSTGNAVQFDIQPGYTVITPEDHPIFKYLRFLRLKVTFITAPTSGTIMVYAVKKR